jgi:hypothetical protein
MKTKSTTKQPPSQTLQIYISNLSEDVWPFINEMQNKIRQDEIIENASLSDRDLFSFAGEDNTVVVLPQEVEPIFSTYYHELFGSKNFHIFTPKKHSGETSRDLWNDKDLILKIKKISAHYSRINLKSYSASSQFYSLLEKFKTIHPNVTNSESPAETDSWTVNFFGSKSGIHQLANTLDLTASPAFVVSGKNIATKLAANFYLNHRGVVIKTNKGHSGAGIVMFRHKELPADNQARIKQISEELKANYWQKFPIVIEKFIPSDPNIGGGFPNAEFKITPNGQVKLLYHCGMRVTRDGVFKGVEINEQVLSPKIVSQIINTGFTIGEKMAEFGYRGYYDVDFIAGKDKKMYLTESNIRRTGGTHVYHTAKALFGEKFMQKTFVLSQNIYSLPKPHAISFSDLKKTLDSILYNKKTKQGLVISSANLLSQNKFGYIIFASNKTKAIEIEKKMESLLS